MLVDIFNLYIQLLEKIWEKKYQKETFYDNMIKNW